MQGKRNWVEALTCTEHLTCTVQRCTRMRTSCSQTEKQKYVVRKTRGQKRREAAWKSSAWREAVTQTDN